ncbi:MAG: SSI family serine proteinase inhibitor [Gaiellaceae bacterium]
MLVAIVAFLLGWSWANLRVTVWPAGRDGPAKTATLRCGPVGGTLPERAAACARLSAFQVNPFLPTPVGIACTQIYGGPEEALVAGRFRGRPVWARFHRRDGCGIARWNRVSFLFAPPL